jgi:PIN domain nuclease of toxin-antitoxin system
MKVLLDTVALYRAATQPESVPNPARAVLEDPSNSLFVSLVSAWELAIKVSLGKLPMPCAVDEFFSQSSRDLLAESITLDLSAIARVAQLPAHHRDPFDRLIISQAIVGGHAIMTSDTRFAAYGVEVIW